MSVDRRLREGLGGITSQVNPDVDRNLHQTFRGARRRIAARRAGAAFVVGAAIAVAILAGPRALDALRNVQHPRPASTPIPSPTLTDPAAVAGTYRIVLTSGQPAVRQNGMGGRWTIRLGANGVITATAPSSFTSSRSGYRFGISGDRFRTDLFSTNICSGVPPGVYRWQLSGTTLSFARIDDSCAARVALFASGPWRSS